MKVCSCVRPVAADRSWARSVPARDLPGAGLVATRPTADPQYVRDARRSPRVAGPPAPPRGAGAGTTAEAAPRTQPTVPRECARLGFAMLVPGAIMLGRWLV